MESTWQQRVPGTSFANKLTYVTSSLVIPLIICDLKGRSCCIASLLSFLERILIPPGGHFPEKDDLMVEESMQQLLKIWIYFYPVSIHDLYLNCRRCQVTPTLYFQLIEVLLSPGTEVSDHNVSHGFLELIFSIA